MEAKSKRKKVNKMKLVDTRHKTTWRLKVEGQDPNETFYFKQILQGKAVGILDCIHWFLLQQQAGGEPPNPKHAPPLIYPLE